MQQGDSVRGFKALIAFHGPLGIVTPPEMSGRAPAAPPSAPLFRFSVSRLTLCAIDPEIASINQP